jgi:hypothetical protein
MNLKTKSARRSILRTVLLALAGVAVLTAQTIPNETEFRVRLTSPLDTRTNQRGDSLTAQVISPAGFQGDMMEGKVREVKNGNKIKGKSVLNFTFETLHHGGSPVSVQSSVKSMKNSKGQPDVDEEGRVIRQKNNVGKAALGAGLGALVGAAVGGGKGAAIGAGVGAVAALVLIEVGTEGPSLAFAAGSEFTLLVKERR